MRKVTQLTTLRAFGLFSGAVVAAAGVYACSSSSNNSAPPVNDSGTETDSTMPDGESDSMPASDGPTGDSPANTDGGPPPACSSLPGTKIYIQSGDTQETILDQLGRELRDSANITILFQLTGSCTVTPNIYNAVPLPKNSNMLYIPSTAEAPNWTYQDPEYTCTTDPNNTTPLDMGISALFPSSCNVGSPPSNIGTFNGPIQAYTFVVPSAEYGNGQTSITAEEAYYAFGDGANNPVLWMGDPEWNIPTQFYLRPASKSTLVSTAFNIGLTAAQMTLATADGGTSDGRQLLASSGDVASAIIAATSPQAIGILGSEVYDSTMGRATTFNELAFAGFGQTAAYLPDSTTTSFDKQNLRNGNYSLWSPAVILAPSSGTPPVPTNPTVAYFVDAFLGKPGAVPPNGFIDGGTPIDGLGATILAGLTPDCAMQVNRPSNIDGSGLMPYQPAAPCTCYYLANVPQPAALPASCSTCTQSSDCTEAGAVGCYHGYCETWPPPSVASSPSPKSGVVYPGDGGLQMLNP
jgi:hypothetical protein